jgi:pantetheine-phosphate adenylyltransferase
MPKRAVYPGSFDPITNGHIDILERALGVFDEVVVVVAGTPRKQPLAEMKERAELIAEVVASHSRLKGRVRVDTWSGLIMDYAAQHGISAVVRGLRAASDFEYEFMMASMNKKINPKVETVFMMTSQDLYFVSSTMVKELYLYGGDISSYVPAPVLEWLERKGIRKPGAAPESSGGRGRTS